MTTREVIQALFAAIDRGDLERFRDLCVPDLYYERPRFPALHGVDAMIRFYRDERPIASGEHLIEHIVADEVAGAAWGRYRGLTRSGAAVDVVWADVYQFDLTARIRTRRGYFFETGELKL